MIFFGGAQVSRVAGGLDAKVEECIQQILWLTALLCPRAVSYKTV